MYNRCAGFSEFVNVLNRANQTASFAAARQQPHDFCTQRPSYTSSEGGSSRGGEVGEAVAAGEVMVVGEPVVAVEAAVAEGIAEAREWGESGEQWWKSFIPTLPSDVHFSTMHGYSLTPPGNPTTSTDAINQTDLMGITTPVLTQPFNSTTVGFMDALANQTGFSLPPPPNNGFQVETQQ
ncbi:hypothetical protein BDQ12DRAFT_669984 [Crucibulum laeve]|uniref:Uncharacterized protein n=1 Tax=Crucibulum laeve TaxID=68775 RepID=A0A5C3LN99_9AGAR|nr:hypothetical protein BDQ12DRAFT_669984 [Crucibulum laeve]